MKRRERSPAENSPQWFRRARERLGRIHVQPHRDKAHAPHQARMKPGAPVDTEFLADNFADNEQRDAACQPDESRRLGPFLSTRQTIKVLNEG